MTASKSRLSARDWTDAALEAMAEQGTAGVNVEQLARQLGATKGSFYHHFENRQQLLDAALARWEEVVAADFVTASSIPDPRERLLVSSLAGAGTRLDAFVDLALAASIDQQSVAVTVKRVNESRISYISGLLRELGVPPDACRERATSGLAMYLGLCQLQLMTGERFDEDRIRSLITDVVDWMLRGQALPLG